MSTGVASSVSRVEFLKKQYAGIIEKSRKVFENPSLEEKKPDVRCCIKGSVADRMKMRRAKLEKERKELARKAVIQKRRVEARKVLEAMSNETGICDHQQVTRDFEKLTGYSSENKNQHVSMTQYGSNSLFVTFAVAAKLKGKAECWDKYKESFCHAKPVTQSCNRHVLIVSNAKELEAGKGNNGRGHATKKLEAVKVIDRHRHVTKELEAGKGTVSNRYVTKELHAGKCSDCPEHITKELEARKGTDSRRHFTKELETRKGTYRRSHVIKELETRKSTDVRGHVKNEVLKQVKEGKISDCYKHDQNGYELEEGEIID